MTRRVMILLSVLALAMVTGCGFSVQKLPLPGGADVGDNPMEVTVIFPDVLDLVPQSTVKVADVTVGKITDITLKDDKAEVRMVLRDDVDLPSNAVAEIRQTSLLGEKFVSLEAPSNPTTERLADGDRIKESSTNRNPEVEEVLGALSLVLNGGGVAQLKTISSELNKALGGREDSARSVLTSLRTFMKQLDDNKGDVVTAIESLNNLSKQVNKQKPSITSALDELPAALDSIDQQRADLVKMLKALARLGKVGTRVIKVSKASTIDALTQLDPVLTGLARSGDDFANAFSVFLTYPFVDESVGRDPQVARNLHMGDYVNLAIKLDVKLLADGGETACIPLGQIPTNGDIDLKDLCDGALKKVKDCLDAPNLEKCLKALDPVLEAPCTILPQLCTTGADGDKPKLLDLDDGGSVIDDLLGGLNRPAPGSGRTRSVPLPRAMDAYDPSLARILLPGVAQ
ncbi:MCE family protein [Nocardioides sp. JQ2195]|uniref:MCE family protein n=1 Tax=Nocardioides sp. JQ2195 TaxID=2592334 RepID=UPI00143E13B3|nr:MCE family protein [Nocardioides sp. JQ2195]QIX28055.1 MCE family protein [Nocardioides sp. JQ2195]